MRSPTLYQKRLVAGVWLVVFLFAVGNDFLAWGILGDSAKLFRTIVMFVGLAAYAWFGPRMMEEMYAHRAAMKEAEEAAERTRDKSSDAAETDRIRWAIGMPMNSSSEPDAQQAADRPKTGSG